MRKISLFFIFFWFISDAFPQIVSEKQIVSFPQFSKLDAYSFKCDIISGTYLYTAYDDTSQKFTIYSNKGNSNSYSSVIDYSVIIDTNGNYYVVAYKEVDSVYTYCILENGIEIAAYDFIDASWKLKDGIIYFVCKENGWSYFSELNISSGKITKGKAYSNIFLIKYPEDIYEGEPVGEIGFTEEGKTYYLATLNNEKFLVIGGVEQKHYSDIEMYYFEPDNDGVLTYFAKDKGKFYEEKGNTFVVQGEKEYKKFDYLYGPILFDSNNIPIYNAGDSSSNYIYPQRVVTGNKEGKSYSGGAYYIQFTPSGKLAYIASIAKDPEKGIYASFVVIDGKEGKKYKSVSYLDFLPGDIPLYAAVVGADQSVIVAGTKETRVELPNIIDLRLLPNGKIAYVETAYGNFEKKQKDRFVVHIGEDEFGPFDGMQFLYSQESSYIISDTEGNYVFVASFLKDFKTYMYENVLYTKDGKSRKFDYFENVNLYKGKPLYIASRLTDRINYIYEFYLYYDFKKLGSVYNSIGDFNFDENTGLVSFMASIGKNFYYVEVRL